MLALRNYLILRRPQSGRLEGRTVADPMVARPRSTLFLELSRSPSDRGGDAFGGDDVAEFLAEFGLRRVERADDVEPGVERGAEAGGVGAAVDRTFRRKECLRGY